jgi:isopenicillin-N N-acyltransferase like protein
MSDQGFPIIRYNAGLSPREWGRMHGESYRTGIQELIAIRTGLMREKNPGLTPPRIADLAIDQWGATLAWDDSLSEELAGIAEGAGVSAADITVLNNYTDFRDIQVPDQGCSVVFVNSGKNPVAGQTWDMHASAKKYVCCLQVPCEGYDSPMVLFSLVGCIGMMGYHPSGQMIGVNNINTDGARAGVMWPAVVRKSLVQNGLRSMVDCLTRSPVTSGHSYLLASREGGEFWEVMPELSERVSSLDVGEDGFLYHTNHCLGERAKRRETPLAVNSTTHVRFGLIEKKIPAVKTFDEVYNLLNDHENYPMSICSNYQSNAQDPSVTCGGAVGELASGRVRLWRGDPHVDNNFVCHDFSLQPAAAGDKDARNR